MSRFDSMLSNELPLNIKNLADLAMNPSYWALTNLDINRLAQFRHGERGTGRGLERRLVERAGHPPSGGVRRRQPVRCVLYANDGTCTAVGAYAGSSGKSETWAEERAGSHWSTQSTARPPRCRSQLSAGGVVPRRWRLHICRLRRDLRGNRCAVGGGVGWGRVDDPGHPHPDRGGHQRAGRGLVHRPRHVHSGRLLLQGHLGSRGDDGRGVERILVGRPDHARPAWLDPERTVRYLVRRHRRLHRRRIRQHARASWCCWPRRGTDPRGSWRRHRRSAAPPAANSPASRAAPPTPAPPSAPTSMQPGTR